MKLPISTIPAHDKFIDEDNDVTFNYKFMKRRFGCGARPIKSVRASIQCLVSMSV